MTLNIKVPVEDSSRQFTPVNVELQLIDKRRAYRRHGVGSSTYTAAISGVATYLAKLSLYLYEAFGATGQFTGI